jgi:hypothetical protein
VAADLSEHHLGSCGFDADLKVADRYRLVNQRAGLPIGGVDGRLLRAVPFTP